jgi:choline dehydrogenase-like flavoprotein
VPYYRRAQRTAGLGGFEWYDLDACRPYLEHPALDVDGAVLTTKIVQTCPVLSFAELHRARLEASRNVEILLGAQALRLRTSGDADRISAVEAADRNGRRLVVEADLFVLAAGGVENARLLLCSGDSNRPGPGNEHDLVGRFFMEHWFFDIGLGGWKNGDLGLYENRDRGLHEELESVGDAWVWAQLVLSDELMEGEQLPGLGLWFVRTPRDALSVKSARRLVKPLIGRARSDRPGTDLRLILTDPAEVPRHLLNKLGSRGRLSETGHALRVQIEQTPDPDSRIRLSAAKDRFGQRLPQLDLALRPERRRDHLRSVEIAAAAIGLDGNRIGKQTRLLLDAGWFGFFWHHMGTTRMAADPTRGVVDADCRVHGTANLFVVGSSVFPTGGTAAPTLTVVALAIRLADHVRRLLSPPPARSGQTTAGRPQEAEIPVPRESARGSDTRENDTG